MSTKALEDLSDKALRQRHTRGEKVLAELDAADPAEVVRTGQAEQNLETMRSTIASLGAVEAELARRSEEGRRNHIKRIVEAAPLRRRLREEEDERKARQAKRRVLDNVLRFAHSELEGERLDPGRLDDEQVAALKALIARKLSVGFQDEGAQPLTEEENVEYERLVGTAAGDEDIFTRKRSEAAARQKLRELEKKRKRHPQAANIVAAVMGDPDVFDLLHERLREDVRVIDEYGHESKGVATARILEPEHISTLYIAVALIAENGGREITIRDNGYIERRREEGRLPFLQVKTLGQLRRNGFLTVRTEGSQRLIGPGPRMRTLADKWGIELPEE